MQARSKKALIGAAFLLAVAGLVFVGLRGCTLMPWSKAGTSGKARVRITRDFGKPMKDASVPVKSGQSAMDVLKGVADVRTEYGGGFVASIEGLSSQSGGGRTSDWFYYVNGILAGSGAVSYQVKPGDNIWWDYHPWSRDSMASAVVGAYPMPFTRGAAEGKRTSLVVYGKGMEGPAREAGAYLGRSGASVAYSSDVAGFARGRVPAIAFLTTAQAQGTPWVTDLLKAGSRSGAFVALDGGRLVALDGSGKPAPDSAGLSATIVSTGSGIGDASPVWLVLCANSEGVSRASRLLTAGGGMDGRFGVAVEAGGQLLSLPR
jgi:hypothetical protein